MHREEPISPTHQMYLKALYRLTRDHPVGRVRDLAEELELTPGTVSASLNRLQEMGLVEREHYGGAVLTPSGAALARCVVRRFETLKSLLIQVFGVDREAAEGDACLMEHAVSPVTVNRMTRFLDHLKAGHSIELATLDRLYENHVISCAECEAEGFCQAAEPATAGSGARA